MGTARSAQSPLQSDRGTTTIQDGVVSSVAATAVEETDGIDPSHGGTRLPGDTSPTVGEFVGRISGGAGRTRGISVQVGEEQAALDLTVNV
ncbi:MAG: Asp23/Gls24 family envelope stress response protein, partial [Actinobacteria bacterium]|nr:Asp23/Gls24 family envelope stress response protein [Actinomycetota bacterium]